MPLSPTRREQLELDELLSDIYRGIEQLPDTNGRYVQLNSGRPGNKWQDSGGRERQVFAKSQVREYELDASSPIVKQHKRELSELLSQQSQSRQSQDKSDYSSSLLSHKQPQRSTLKRSTNKPPSDTPQQQRSKAQSLASFVSGSLTPENKRRVRIIDEPERLSASGGEEAEGRRPKVKYVNTNKFIYHQERSPDDPADADSYDDRQVRGGRGAHSGARATEAEEDDEVDLVDGVTRVEYYHTNWLDRQLGRASKRRSSKELNERQVREKAMIEELKRSLKNGAITLRRSFKGKRDKHKAETDFEEFDFDPPRKEQRSLDDSRVVYSKTLKPQASAGNNNNYYGGGRENSLRNQRQPPNASASSSVFGSGLATIPRNYHNHNSNSNQANKHSSSNYYAQEKPTSGDKRQPIVSQEAIAPRPVERQQPMETNFDEPYNSYSSRTLPQSRNNSDNNSNSNNNFNYNRSTTTTTTTTTMRGTDSRAHQLLQSHYRPAAGSQQLNRNYNTLASGARVATPCQQTSTLNRTTAKMTTEPAPMHNYPNSYYNSSGPTAGQTNTLPARRGVTPTIGSIPSATEVVRSALSRSNSQLNVNQLNKTINLLPNSPPPYASGSPMSPATQQLKAASPSLSPSPICGNGRGVHQNMPHQQPATGTTTTLYGTRIIDNKPISQPHPQQQQQPQQQQPQQQSVYANPHASLMQHRMEQQQRQPGSRNVASIREFNELDSLLRSLGPGVSTHVTPGFSSRPAAPTFGGYMPANYQPTTTTTNTSTNSLINKANNDVYAQVHKQQRQPQPQTQPQQQQQQQQPNYNPYNQSPQAVVANVTQPSMSHQQPYTIDVTNKNVDENCLARQDLSEFEPPTDLVPSMVDYQNISRLNPVKNQYWYKPNMSRDRAISLLKDKPQGTFIVRDSNSFKGAYGLAVRVTKLPKNVLRSSNGDPSADYIRHFLIEPVGNGVRLKGYANEPIFNSLPSLIYQHSLTELALPCKLVIPRADIEDPKFNQKQKQFYDEFLATKEQAKHLPYETTSPDGGYRKYPGDVYIHNEHRIIFE